MEIFQTIWNVLTTENEVITNIICSPLTFVEAYVSMLLFTSILKINSSSQKNIIYVLTFSVIALITKFTIPMPYNTLINVIACPLLVIIIYKTTLLKAILSEILPLFISVCFGSLLQIFYQYMFNLSMEIMNIIPVYRITFSLLSYLFMYFAYLISKYFKFYIELIDNMNKKSKSIIFINFFIGIIAIFIQSYIATRYSSIMPKSLTVSTISVLVIYFIFSIFSLLRTTKLEKTTEKLKEEQLHNKTLTVLYDNIRGFKHDFNNIIQGIGGYIATNNTEGLKEYYSQVLDDCQRVNNLTILTPEIINNPPIYSLLTTKYYKATELGIKVNLEIFMDLSVINMKIYELTRVLGILLDNAIEASKNSEEKEINIIIRKDSRKNKQLFIIENTYSNKNVNIDEIFEKGHTSKTSKDSKNHGLGLWEVRQLVKKNTKTIDLYTTKDNKYFKQQFEIMC